VFVRLLRQVRCQPVQHFFISVNFKRYKKELNALRVPPNPRGQAVTVLAAQSLSSRQPTLSCKPLHSFHRYYAQRFVPQLLRSVAVPFVSAARSPSAARVRLACWSLRAAAELFYFASASLWHFLAVALCTRSTPCCLP
jgi:hypothetical protein